MALLGSFLWGGIRATIISTEEVVITYDSQADLYAVGQTVNLSRVTNGSWSFIDIHSLSFERNGTHSNVNLTMFEDLNHLTQHEEPINQSIIFISFVPLNWSAEDALTVVIMGDRSEEPWGMFAVGQKMNQTEFEEWQFFEDPGDIVFVDFAMNASLSNDNKSYVAPIPIAYFPTDINYTAILAMASPGEDADNPEAVDLFPEPCEKNILSYFLIITRGDYEIATQFINRFCNCPECEELYDCPECADDCNDLDIPPDEEEGGGADFFDIPLNQALLFLTLGLIVIAIVIIIVKAA